MASQAELRGQLQDATAIPERRDLALQLLAQTKSRQQLDEVLRVLQSAPVIASLDERHRPVLRQKCFSYYADSRRDKAGILREGLTRLLVHIAHPADIDLYQLGVETYYLQPVDDVAQNLRAAALAGLAPIDPALACLYATRFLGDSHTSVFNCEPALTALAVLVSEKQRLPIYQFLLRDGLRMAQTGRGELTGKALEALGADFPPPLYKKLIEQYRAIDQPTASLGIINFIVEGRIAALYDQLEELILATRDLDLRRYGLVMLAAARDNALSERLLRLAALARYDDVPLFIDALEICQHPERDAALANLRRRQG